LIDRFCGSNFLIGTGEGLTFGFTVGIFFLGSGGATGCAPACDAKKLNHNKKNVRNFIKKSSEITV
jgi:hypothetical protein